MKLISIRDRLGTIIGLQPKDQVDAVQATIDASTQALGASSLPAQAQTRAQPALRGCRAACDHRCRRMAQYRAKASAATNTASIDIHCNNDTNPIARSHSTCNPNKRANRGTDQRTTCASHSSSIFSPASTDHAAFFALIAHRNGATRINVRCRKRQRMRWRTERSGVSMQPPKPFRRSNEETIEQKELYLYDEAHASTSFYLTFTAEEVGTIAVMVIQGLPASEAIPIYSSALRGVQRVLRGCMRSDCWPRISLFRLALFRAVRETLADRVPILRRVEDAARFPREAGLRVTASPPIIRILPNLLVSVRREKVYRLRLACNTYSLVARLKYSENVL